MRRIQLGVKVAVRGGRFAHVISLAYQVMAFGTLASPMGSKGTFFAGASDPT